MKLSLNAGNRLAFAFVLVAVGSLAACGGGGGSSGPGPTPPTTKPTTPTSTPTGTTPTPTPTPTGATPAPSMMPTATPSPVPTSTPPAFAPPPPPPPGDTNVIFQFGVPNSPLYQYAHGQRYYISPMSQSLGVVDTLGGAGSTYFNLGTPTNPGPGCTDTPTTLYCQEYAAVPNGQHDFKSTFYPNPGATGPALSIGDTGPITLSGMNQIQSVLFKAVVYGIALSLQTPNPPVGTPIYDTLHITLTDAAGVVIASDSQYNPGDALYNPVTLSSSNTKDGPLNRYAVNVQSDVSRVYVTYDGANVGPITYSASASGVSPSNVQNATLTP